MSVTMKLISEISGVSRGTVDRVLNNRGKVSPETEELVRRVASELGYRPNRAGMALAARKKSFVIGVLLTSVGVPFFEELVRGVRDAEIELREYGVAVELLEIKGYSVATQLQALDSLAQTANAIIFNPINDPQVAKAISRLAARGISTIAVNTDIQADGKLCYVGSNYTGSGHTAAGMLRLMLGPGDKNIAVFGGSKEIIGHCQRLEGFAQVLQKKCPSYYLLPTVYTEDDDLLAYERAVSIFTSSPAVQGIYIGAAGTYGICRAVSNLFSPSSRPKIVCCDLTAQIGELMQQDIIQAAICQQPYTQGYQAMQKAFDYLVSSFPPENYFVENEIKILENSGF